MPCKKHILKRRAVDALRSSAFQYICTDSVLEELSDNRLQFRSVLWPGSARYEQSNIMIIIYVLRSISLIAGRFLLWVACVHSFLHSHRDFAMIPISGADISIIIAFFGGMPYSPPILHCRAVELQPLRSPSHYPLRWMPKMISGAK